MLIMSYYEKKAECYKKIDPMILKGEPTEFIVLAASMYGFGAKMVHERMNLLEKVIAKKRQIKSDRIINDKMGDSQ